MADVDDTIAYVRKKIDTTEGVSLELLVSLCRELEWRLKINPMPGGETLACVTAHGKPFTSRGPFPAQVVGAAMIRALDYFKPQERT